jgi:hypothetical protein
VTAPTKWAQPQPVDDLALSFGGRMADLLPPVSEIPAEFHRHNGTEWNRRVSAWFFSGLKGRLVPREGVDSRVAVRHLQAILGSWEPKHEHKEAGVAYLMSLWFDRFEEAA